MPPIVNGADVQSLGGIGNLPQMGDTLLSWLQPTVFTIVTKAIVNFEVQETGVQKPFMAVIQPFSAKELMLRPEGQRSWNWLTLHALPSVPLNVDDVIAYRGKDYRVMSQYEYQDYGYYEYHVCENYTGSGPTVGGV